MPRATGERMTEEQRRVVEQHIPMAWDAVRRAEQFAEGRRAVAVLGGDKDAVQWLLERMCRAARTFDPDKAKFTTYVYPHLLRWLLDEARTAKLRFAAAMGSLDHEPSPGCDWASLHDVVPDPSAPDAHAEAVRSETAERVRALLERLPPRHRLVAQRRFLEGRTHAEIAAELGVVKERVRQVEAQALAWLRVLAAGCEPQFPTKPAGSGRPLPAEVWRERGDRLAAALVGGPLPLRALAERSGLFWSAALTALKRDSRFRQGAGRRWELITQEAGEMASDETLAAIDKRIAALEGLRRDLQTDLAVLAARLEELRSARGLLAGEPADDQADDEPAGQQQRPAKKKPDRPKVPPRPAASPEDDARHVLAILREKGPLSFAELAGLAGMRTPRLARSLEVGGWFEKGDGKWRPTTLGHQVGKE